jgi:hypothetical protein
MRDVRTKKTPALPGVKERRVRGSFSLPFLNLEVFVLRINPIGNWDAFCDAHSKNILKTQKRQDKSLRD